MFLGAPYLGDMKVLISGDETLVETIVSFLKILYLAVCVRIVWYTIHSKDINTYGKQTIWKGKCFHSLCLKYANTHGNICTL